MTAAVRTVWLHTFGCKANQYDTERMRQELESRGARIVEQPGEADTAVLNTCTVTSRADASARQLVRKLAREHPGLRVVVAGCSSALQAPAYRRMTGVVAAVAGHDPVAVASAVAPESGLAARDEEAIGGILLRANRRGTRGWLKIQDGCDRKCSFCATRLARGVSRSRRPEEIVAEARLLACEHAELVLTGIHIGHYGRDLDPPVSVARLCGRLLEALPGVRFRLGSIEATEIDDDLVDLLETSGGALAPHLHVPLQSGSDAVLRRMRRWHTRDAYRARVLHIAERVQPLGLGADVISGFPGETDEDHRATQALIEELPYSYLHVFPWSPRTGTVAASLDGRVPQRIAAEWARELRELGVAGGRTYVAGRIGESARVAVETAAAGLTGDYLRVRVDGEPGTLIDAVLTGTEGALRADAAGRRALPVVTAAV